MNRIVAGVVPLLLGLAVSLATHSPVRAMEGKLQIYGHRLVPYDEDAERFSRDAWGGGLNALMLAPGTYDLLAFVGGLELTNLLSRTTEFRDSQTGLRVEQQTNQQYFRLYTGGRFGPHGNGLIRPFVGSNLALVVYWIGTDVVVPDDTDRENEIRQHLSDETKAAFGYDFSVGIDWNLGNRVPIETGVRYVRSFNVPQQLGEGSVEVHPTYIQYYVGVGLNFGRPGDVIGGGRRESDLEVSGE